MRLPLALLLFSALCLSSASAGELATMPTPDMRGENEIWGTYYHIWLSPPAGPKEEMGLVDVSVGLTPDFEADLVYGSGGGMSFTTLNLAVRLSAPEDVKVTAGVVNLFSADEYFRSDKPSPYLMASKCFPLGNKEEKEANQERKPVVLQPFLAWGANTHSGWFGGLTAELSPQTKVTLANYPDPWGAHKALFALSYSLPEERAEWALGIGIWGGNPWLSVSTPGGWIPWPRLP